MAAKRKRAKPPRTQSARNHSAPDAKPAPTREMVMNAFQLPDCAALKAELQNDLSLTDEERLQRLQDHRADMHKLCQEVARTASQGKGTVEIMNLAATVAAQIRISFLSAVDRAAPGGFNVSADAYDTCMSQLSQEAGCEGLRDYEHQLLARLQAAAPVGWKETARARITRVVQRGTQFVVQAKQFTAEGTWRAVQWVVSGFQRLWGFLVPPLVRFGMYMLHSPRAALLALMYVNHTKRHICRLLAKKWILHWKEATMNQRRDGKTPGREDPQDDSAWGNVKEYMRKIGTGDTYRARLPFLKGHDSGRLAGTLKGSLGGAIGSIVQSGLADGGSYVADLMPLLGEALGTWIGMPQVGMGVGHVIRQIMKTSTSIASDVLREAAEFAAYQNDMDNAFSEFFRVLDIHDCVKVYSEEMTLAYTPTHSPGRHALGSNQLPKKRPVVEGRTIPVMQRRGLNPTDNDTMRNTIDIESPPDGEGSPDGMQPPGDNTTLHTVESRGQGTHVR